MSIILSCKVKCIAEELFAAIAMSRTVPKFTAPITHFVSAATCPKNIMYPAIIFIKRTAAARAAGIVTCRSGHTWWSIRRHPG